MKWYAIAFALLASIGTLASAQPPVIGGSPPPGPGAPAPKAPPAPIIIPITTGAPHGFYKSGGVLVGANGLFPFDTGEWILGGTEGLTRSTGFFYVAPSTSTGTMHTPRRRFRAPRSGSTPELIASSTDDDGSRSEFPFRQERLP